MKEKRDYLFTDFPELMKEIFVHTEFTNTNDILKLTQRFISGFESTINNASHRLVANRALSQVQPISKINEYTGIFEGKNVIAIHAESLQNFALGLTINGQEITPNLNISIFTYNSFKYFYSINCCCCYSTSISCTFSSRI